MAEPFIGEIRIMPYTYAPYGWAICNGDLIPIQQNTALFSILGTTYGGDGKTNFALPNLKLGTPAAPQGVPRVPIHPGNGPGLTPRKLGQAIGEQTHTLTEAEMPNHTHTLQVSRVTKPEYDTPAINTLPHVLLVNNIATTSYKGVPDNTKNVPMSSSIVAYNGKGQAHENRQPFLQLNYFIALDGVYPTRS